MKRVLRWTTPYSFIASVCDVWLNLPKSKLIKVSLKLGLCRLLLLSTLARICFLTSHSGASKQKGPDTSTMNSDSLSQILFSHNPFQMLFFSSLALAFTHVVFAQPEYTPEPFYSYSPLYDPNGCDPSDTPINGILGKPLPLETMPAASAANVAVSGFVVIRDGCNVSLKTFSEYHLYLPFLLFLLSSLIW